MVGVWKFKMGVSRFVSADSFVCRYTWLTKLVRGLSEDSNFLSEQYDAMVKLGVGSNMLSAIRTWGREMGIMEEDKENKGFLVTQFGEQIFGNGGLDEFLEDQDTLWLLHWNLCTHRPQPMHAWDYLINHWHKADFSASEILAEFNKTEVSTEASRKRHLDVFLRTYVGSSAAKNEIQEDKLDSPLVEINFIHKIGDRAVSMSSDDGKRESIYSFRMEEKPEISNELIIYCLTDFWKKFRSSEETLDFPSVGSSPFSVGQVFKLPERAIRNRLENIEELTGGSYKFDDSAAVPKIIREKEFLDPGILLSTVYSK